MRADRPGKLSPKQRTRPRSSRSPSPLLPPDSMPQQQQAWADPTPAGNQYQPDDQYQQDQQYQDDFDTASLDDGGSDDSWT